MNRTPEPRGRDNRTLVWTIVASQFGPPFMFSGVAVALPAMGSDLAAGATSLALVETLFLAGSVSFLLPAGRLADTSDRTKLYRLGLLSFVVTSVLIAALSWMPVILLIRFLQGVASAVVASTGPAILADLVPAEQRGRTYGSSMGAIYAGLTLGPIIAGVLIQLWGWRAVFVMGAATILCGYVLVRALLPRAPRAAGPGVHVPSTILVVSAVSALVAGSATVRQGLVGYAFLLGGLALVILFVVLQRRLRHPLLDVEALMRNRILRSALLVQLLLYVNAFASFLMLSIYMQVSLGRSASRSGQILAVGSVLMALMAPVAGSLADRYPARHIAIFGVASVSISALMAITLHQESSLAFVASLLAIQGVGFAFFSSPNMKIIMNSVSADRLSTASALAAKARGLGMISGTLIAAMLISLDLGNDPVEQHPIRFIGTAIKAFSIVAALDVVALVVSIRAARRPTEPPATSENRTAPG